MTTQSAEAAGASNFHGLPTENPTYQDYLYRWRKLVCLREVLQKPIKDGINEIGGKVDMLRDCLPVLFPDKKDEKTAAVGILVKAKEKFDKSCEGGSMTHDYLPTLTYGEATQPSYQKPDDESPETSADSRPRMEGDELIAFVEKRIANLKFVLNAIGGYDPQEEIEKHWFAADDQEKTIEAVHKLADTISKLDVDVSKRFAMEKLLSWTPEEIAQNEKMLAEEMRAVENQPGNIRFDETGEAKWFIAKDGTWNSLAGGGIPELEGVIRHGVGGYEIYQNNEWRPFKVSVASGDANESDILRMNPGDGTAKWATIPSGGTSWGSLKDEIVQIVDERVSEIKNDSANKTVSLDSNTVRGLKVLIADAIAEALATEKAKPV